ncbi:MAG: PhoH family protein [Candidatus Nomurabacteria bacterium]|nr:PhoH family protein [Candidatus Nomurabacteria bacterium]
MENQKKLKMFVLDTNVVLHDSSCIYKFQEHDVVIPIQVIEEIDTFKKGLDAINWHAREFCRIIDDLSEDHIFNGGVSLGEGSGKLTIAMAKPLQEKVRMNLKTKNVDMEIINLAYCLKEERQDREVVIVSKDINLRIKSKALCILAQDFMHETVSDLNILSEKVKTIDVPSKIIDLLYKGKMPVPYNIKDATANQNFILKSEVGNQTALVCHRNGLLTLILKDSQSAFGIKSKNSEQSFAVNALLDTTISLVAIEGKAGTGKTLLSLACGLSQMEKDLYDQVLYSRVTISMGDREIGFLPGDANDKIGPFMNGMNDNINVIISANTGNVGKIDAFKRNEKLVIEPLPFIRGRSIHKSLFILDECQNLTPHEIKTIVTRAGEGTKIVLIGDTHQIDNPYLDQKSNGFSYLIQKFQDQDCYCYVHLFNGVRSSLAELASNLL